MKMRNCDAITFEQQFTLLSIQNMKLKFINFYGSIYVHFIQFAHSVIRLSLNIHHTDCQIMEARDSITDQLTKTFETNMKHLNTT